MIHSIGPNTGPSVTRLASALSGDQMDEWTYRLKRSYVSFLGDDIAFV
jgi:hypothetical protein